MVFGTALAFRIHLARVVAHRQALEPRLQPKDEHSECRRIEPGSKVSTLHPAVIGLAMGTAWTIPASLIGGTAPMLMAWANKQGHPMFFICYLVVLCVIAGVVVLGIGQSRPPTAE